MSRISVQTSEKSATWDLMYQATAATSRSEKRIWRTWRVGLLAFGVGARPSSGPSPGGSPGPPSPVTGGLTVAPPRDRDEPGAIPASVDRPVPAGNNRRVARYARLESPV